MWGSGMHNSITLKNIKFSYTAETVLDIADLSIERNRVTVITGPNGSGKTTLLKILSGLLLPELGEIFFEGTVLLNRRKRKILLGNSTYVHQTPYIFSGSVKRNVTMGMKGENKCKGLLEAFDLAKYRNSRASKLSGGEKQKIALARAAGMERNILLLDEPLAHIDSESKVVIEKILKTMSAEGKTLIIATHDHNFASDMADTIIYMENGKIVRSIK
ncbi:MAG: ABC transporter ATP-binding protein [Spirochaetes bacterium]|nr:MAG: ABC transporter ATP-binding protein [Spirochaetota bacterium]